MRVEDVKELIGVPSTTMLRQGIILIQFINLLSVEPVKGWQYPRLHDEQT